MRNPPAPALRRKMMLLSWQERSRWLQEEKGELFNPSLPPQLIAGASPVMLSVPQRGRVDLSRQWRKLCRHFQGRGALLSPALQGLLPAALGTSQSLLCCIVGRAEKLWGLSPACPTWWQSQEQDFVWEPETLSVQHYPCQSLISSVPFSLRKQLFFIVTQACFSCSVLCYFFLSLRNSCVWVVQYCPLMLCLDFKENFPTSVMPQSFFVLAAALIFCFLHLIAIMPCNERAECLSPECETITMFSMSEHILVIFTVNIPEDSWLKMFQRILVFYSWTLLKIVWRVIWITGVDAFHIFLKLIDHIKNSLSRVQRRRMKNLNVKYWNNFLTPIKNWH